MCIVMSWSNSVVLNGERPSKRLVGGDGYASAFLYGLLEGWDMWDALEFGSASAAMLVASHACSQDMPTVDAVKEFIKKEKEEYGEMVARG